MATDNSALISGGPIRGTHVNQFVTFSNSSGDYVSFRSPNAGTYWELQSVRAENAKAGAHDVMFFVADSAGVEHILLSNTGVAPVSVPSGDRLVWNGSVIVPDGWRLYCKFFDLSGSETCNWSYSAIEYDQDSNPDN